MSAQICKVCERTFKACECMPGVASEHVAIEQEDSGCTYAALHRQFRFYSVQDTELWSFPFFATMAALASFVAGMLIAAGLLQGYVMLAVALGMVAFQWRCARFVVKSSSDSEELP